MLTVTAAPAGSATTSDRQLLVEVAAAFGLGPVEAFERVAEGLLNRNWRLTAGGATYAVKQVLDADPEQTRRQHTATTALALRGLPVPAPVADPAGQTLWQSPRGNFCVLAWVAGAHHRGRSWTRAQASQVGRLLAELHQSLATLMPPTPVATAVAMAEPARAKAAVDRYLAGIDARAVLDAFDIQARLRLRQRRELLERVAHLRPDDAAAVEPVGWAHGDFHDLNLLWRSGKVVAVLDWDRLGVRALAGELVRSATLLFGHGDERGLDLDRVAAFTGGYRQVRALTAGQLADAVRRLWWERVCDLWQLKRHYEHNDDSCDHLFTSAAALLGWWSGHRDEVTAAFAN